MSADGIDASFKLHTVAPFTLTSKLRAALARAQGRVVNIATRMPANARIEVDDMVNPRSYSGFRLYTRSKLALLMITLEQAERWQNDGIRAVAVHPGINPGTRFGRDTPVILRAVGPLIARVLGITSTFEQVCERYAMASFGDVANGTFLAEGKVTEPPEQARDTNVRRALWQLLEQISFND